MILNCGLPIIQSSKNDFKFSFSISNQPINFDSYNLFINKKNESTIVLQYALDLTACDLINYSDSLNNKFSNNYNSVFIFELKNKGTSQFLFNRLNELLGKQTQLSRMYCNDSQMLLYQITQVKLKDEWLHLWLIGKAAELATCLYTCITIETNEKDNTDWLNEIQRKKIFEAKNILISQLHQPVPIKTLARRVGLNENYLKRGFKEVFDSTIYQFFQDERMKQAANQLKVQNKSVKEVANNLGYSSISHFSTAFKKSIGLLPCELIK